MKPVQITIPSPCSQNWEKMLPNTNGRFCNNCSTQVVDFTKMSDAQVLNYLNQHSKQYVCARTFASQLNRKMEEPAILKQKKWYWKLLLLPAIFFGKMNEGKAMKNPTEISLVALTKNGQNPVKGEMKIQQDSLTLIIKNEVKLRMIKSVVWVNGTKYTTSDSGSIKIKNYSDLRQLIINSEQTNSAVVEITDQKNYEVILTKKIREPFIMGKIAMPKKD